MSQENDVEEQITEFKLLTQREEKSNFAVFCIIAGPLPILFSLNYVLSFWNLDRLHYILLQFIFLLLFPTILRLQNGNEKLVSLSSENSRQLVKNGYDNTSLENQNTQLQPNLLFADDVHLEAHQAPDFQETKKTFVHRYTKTCDDLFEEIDTIGCGDIEDADICWELIADTSGPIASAIYRDRHASHRYRLECIFDNAPASVFDCMAELFEVNGSFIAKKYFKKLERLEILDANTDIHYLCTASFWPTSARDVCLLRSSKKLDDGSIMTVFKSVQHPLKGIDVSNDATRMEVYLGGCWLRPVLGNPKKCRLVSYLHGDPQGWIPKSLVTFMASNFIPKIFGKINCKVAQLPFKERSMKLVDYYADSTVSIALSDSTLTDLSYPCSLTSSDFEEPYNHDQVSQPESTMCSSSKEPISQIRSSHRVTSPSSFWKRMKQKLASQRWVNRVAASSGPVLLIVAILTVVARRNRP